ncbi:GPI ethanolamine phosphate transferase 1 [Pholiota conissans]|uniref:GPI ethanolamine phosphate transferase 1 n=1 Tax=Pholiota conissans TaxID=109636 RepID=A0A9P6CVM6_9AGAR|nr:GPI ethanolamine phosphate transferase 1 [Pholiota conissans]
MKTEKRPQTYYNVAKLLLLGFVFHLVFINSVFDCYFTSPVVHGMQSYGSQEKGAAAAKRLVLIVGDGLRADLLFSVNAFSGIPGSPELVAPHLRSIVETKGAFGISHTRVPTESRPGHVAIIGGMYEDVSAVTKGWKTNPVDFDSVFNQSTTTYSFGSPDILPMFAKGASPGKVKTWSYDEDEEDFTKDATALDVWVLDQLKMLFHNATVDALLDAQLRSDKVVFFLHLLGLDTTGHSYRPHSKEYIYNIQVVDDVVREAEGLIRDFYGDDDTSFVFTADHGMSVIGNHGDGHPDNTRTPLVAWGSGIRGPIPDTNPTSHDAYSQPWKLNHLFRRDVDQADIASLMAALIGSDWPVNSVGVLPDVDPSKPGYLDSSRGDGAVARAALLNAKVVLEQYRVKHELKQHHSLVYKPYKPLSEVITTGEASQILAIEKLITEEKWDAARQASSDLIQQSLKGLHYLQTYDRFLIRGFVTAAYLGWAAYASLYIFRPLDTIPLSENSSIPNFVTTASWAILFAFWASFALQRSPWSFYIYIAFPCYFWEQFLGQMISYMRFNRDKISTSARFGVHIRGAMVVLALLGMVAGYTHRSVWSVGFALIGVVWPILRQKDLLAEKLWMTVFWACSCLTTAIFPLLSVDKNESLLTIIIGGSVILLTGFIGALQILKSIKDETKYRVLSRLFFVQGIFICLTIIITTYSVLSLQAKRGLPSVSQWSGWIVLVTSSILPFAFKSSAHATYSKILMYFLGFGPCFVILSISVEGLFFVAYSVTLIAWVQIESLVRPSLVPQKYAPSDHKERSLGQVVAYKFQADDLRIALFFLFFVQVGFFGTGNVASISSFYLAPVYRLIPIFNPFYMSTLLVFKIIAPYIMLSVTFAVLNDTLGLPPFSLLMVALTLTDGMTLSFFFKVQDTGSWLEIGQSITFFCIASLLLLWSAGICAAGEYLMADVISARGLSSSRKTK